jgi:hypothetical protein
MPISTASHRREDTQGLGGSPPSDQTLGHEATLPVVEARGIDRQEIGQG